jgi:hypothetical protein
MGKARRRFQDAWRGLPGPLRTLIVLGLLFFVLPWASVQALPVPWAFILGAWAVVLMVRALRRPRSVLRFYGAVALLALAGIEVYLELARPCAIRVEPPSELMAHAAPHPELGYAPVPGSRQHTKAFCDDELVHATTYTIDEDGMRVARQAPDGVPTLAFFGCSLTYGTGLADAATYPNVVAARSGDRFRALNLAFAGWGPHQMLAQLESGRARSLLVPAPTHAFYLAIPAHMVRVAGRAPWDERGPCYRLAADGSVRRDGQFRPGRRREPERSRLEKWLSKSRIVRKFSRPKLREDELDLMTAVVATARDRIVATWPECAFHMLLWDRPGDPRNERVVTAMAERGISVHRVSEMLPGFRDDFHAYVHHEQELHPNARAASGIAEWVVEAFLR